MDCGGHPFKIELQGPENSIVNTMEFPVHIKGSLVDDNNGTYAAWISARSVGLYEVHVTMNGTHIQGSPYRTLVTPGSAFPSI